MNVRSIQSVCCIVRRCVFSLSFGLSLVVSPLVVSPLVADEYGTTCNYNDELCGWVDDKPEPAPAMHIVTLETSIATIVSAIGAKTGVAFQQFVEPFAMVGPYIDGSVEMVRSLDQFWQSMAAINKQSLPVDTEDAIAAVAAMEPIDVDFHGPSVLIGEPNSSEELAPGIEITPIDSLIGSAPMIVTINEPYMPYDLSASDLRLRSVFPFSAQPFCVRSRVADWNIVPMWTEVEHLQIAQTQRRELVQMRKWVQMQKWVQMRKCVQKQAQAAPVDCYLEEFVWLIESWTANDSKLAAAANPTSLGERVAKLVSRGNRMVHQATDLIASHWPQPVVEPSLAGRALLTRAGVETGTKSVGAADALIAEAVSNQSIR